MTTKDRITNILIIKPGAIGDLLQMTPVIRALGVRYPDAGISLMVGSSATAALFKHHAAVRETIVFDKQGVQRSLWSLMKLWQHLRRHHYDLVVNFQRSNLKTWFLASAALPCRVLVYHKSKARNVHAVVNYLETLAPLGIEPNSLGLELTLGADDRIFAAQAIAALGHNKGPVIALNPGASHSVNRWGTDHFAALADMLAQKLAARVIIIGGTEDIILAEEIRAKASSPVLIMTGRANLLQLGALLEQCDILVSGDTGPLHLATAVGTRVVALFGAADPVRTGPVGQGHAVIQAREVPCVPCRSRGCHNNKYLECMDAISPDRVFEAVRSMVQNRGIDGPLPSV